MEKTLEKIETVYPVAKFLQMQEQLVELKKEVEQKIEGIVKPWNNILSFLLKDELAIIRRNIKIRPDEIIVGPIVNIPKQKEIITTPPWECFFLGLHFNCDNDGNQLFYLPIRHHKLCKTDVSEIDRFPNSALLHHKLCKIDVPRIDEGKCVYFVIDDKEWKAWNEKGEKLDDSSKIRDHKASEPNIRITPSLKSIQEFEEEELLQSSHIFVSILHVTYNSKDYYLTLNQYRDLENKRKKMENELQFGQELLRQWEILSQKNQEITELSMLLSSSLDYYK